MTAASLVIQTSFIGDAILSTPLLDALAVRGPVRLVTTPASAPLFEGYPGLTETLVYDKRGADAGMVGWWRMVRRVRRRSLDDTAYLAQGSVRSAALALAAGYRTRIGFTTSAGRAMYSRAIAPRPEQHHTLRLLSLAGPVSTPPPRPRLFPGPQHEALATAVLRPLGGGVRPIALAPGSVWGTKRWPYFPALARDLLAQDFALVIVGGSADARAAREISVLNSERVVDATGQLPLLGTAALLARCAALVTNDSAPLHLASAVNTATVAIFGSTVPALGFGPLAAQHRIAEVTGLSCRPCSAHGPQTCPLGHFSCMRDLAVDQVSRLVISLVRA